MGRAVELGARSMNLRKHVAVAAFALCSIALLSACGGGTSGSDRTKTAQAGGGGAQVTPLATATSAPRTAVALPSAAATGAGASTTPSAAGGASATLQIATPDDMHYDRDTLSVSAGAQVTLTYMNNSELPHDWHLFDGSDATAPTIAQTQIKSGPGATETVSFTAPTAPGRYFYHCDVHPDQMKGFLVVQ